MLAVGSREANSLLFGIALTLLQLTCLTGGSDSFAIIHLHVRFVPQHKALTHKGAIPFPGTLRLLLKTPAVARGACSGTEL